MVAEVIRLGMEMVRTRSRPKGSGCLKGRAGRGSRHLRWFMSGKGVSATFLGHGRVQGAHQKVPSREFSERARKRPRGLERKVLVDVGN